MQISYIVWAVTAGLCVAALCTYFIRRICGAFVKALTDNGCIGEENAKSCKQMGIKPISSYLKKQLGEGGGMSAMVVTQDDTFYIKPEYALLIQKKYPADNMPLIALAGLLVVFAAVGGVIGYMLPSLLDSIGGLF